MSGLGIVKQSKTQVSKEELIKKFPDKKNTITDEVVNLINEANSNPEFNGDEIIKTMTTYQSIMINNSGSLKEYLDAIMFCAFLEADISNYTKAYIKARANDQFVIDRKDLPTDSNGYKELTNAASRYRKTPMVRDILTQAEMPLYLMFQGARYSAVSKLVEEMDAAAFSKDRINAAKAILEHVKPPENMKVELEVGPSSEAMDMQKELNKQLAELASNQKKMLEKGGKLSDVQKIEINVNETIIDAEVE